MAAEKPDELEIENDESDEDEGLVSYEIATFPSDFTLGGIYQMWKDKEITIPEFQREYVWGIKQASLLVESFLLGLPVPPVFFYIDDENKNLVIDGQQRITSMAFYFDGFFGFESIQGKKQVFRLMGLDERSPYFKKKFSDLTETDQRKLRNSVLRAINVKQLSPVENNTSIYHIFERLNTGGTPLKPQEIRNVVFRGEFVAELRELNKDANWRKILGKNNYDKHQADVELVLRIFALSYYLDEYERPMKEFLNQAMKKNQGGTTKFAKDFKKLFPKVAERIITDLGEKPFHRRGPMNTAFLDATFCTLLMYFDSIPDDLSKRFQEFAEDGEMDDYSTLGTTDKNNVNGRFDLASDYFID